MMKHNSSHSNLEKMMVNRLVNKEKKISLELN